MGKKLIVAIALVVAAGAAFVISGGLSTSQSINVKGATDSFARSLLTTTSISQSCRDALDQAALLKSLDADIAATMARERAALAARAGNDVLLPIAREIDAEYTRLHEIRPVFEAARVACLASR